MIKKLILLTTILICKLNAFAHPMPNSVVLMDIQKDGIAVEIGLPLDQLQSAVTIDVTTHPETLIERMGPQLTSYIQSHIHPKSSNGADWTVKVNGLLMGKTEQTDTGPYQELKASLWMTPPAGQNPRSMMLYYDVIIHKLVTHKAMIAIRNDWENGKVGEAQTEVGVIGINPIDNSIPPLQINLDEGSNWRGFKSMVKLGMDHIATGTDHLLFLLVLLLPAPLLIRYKRWAEPGGTRYSVIRLLKITTAFTIGHSITLLAGALGWLRLPSQPVEILIAISILITAIHALRPLFPGNEIYIAAGFGLVHGLAFASTLAALNLTGGRMALSILGFNIGIELMQLFVILLTMPWLIILSVSSFYKIIKTGGAVAAGIAAIAWIAERISNHPNAVTVAVQEVAIKGKWIVLALVLLAMISHFFNKRHGVEKMV